MAGAGEGAVTDCPAARRGGRKKLSLLPTLEPSGTQASASTLEERVSEWAAKKAAAGVPANQCVLPFLTGAPRAVECRLCSKSIYAGEEIKCSVKKCPQMFHLSCVVKDASSFTAERFRCPQHECMVCKQKMFFWRCGRCLVAAHTKCAPWPVVHLLEDNQGRAICWRHTSDWLLQNAYADFTKSIEEVFCRLPLPYVNEDFNIDSTIEDYIQAVNKPTPYKSIRHNVYLIKKKRSGVRVDIGCTNCRADSTCKEDCECRGLSTSCSKNCRCSDLCTNRPFRKDKKIKIVKTKRCGRGAVALEPLERGDFVIEYVGEVIDDATCERRLWDIRERGDKNFYMCKISKDFTIDATFKGNTSRFLNHSCEPNCKLEKWQVDGETRVGVFASCSIKVGEPLTYDCRGLSLSCSKNCRCSDLCTERPFRKDKKIKIVKEIPSVGNFKKQPLKNKDGLKVMFGNIVNEEQDHWNPMSFKPIVSLDNETPVDGIEAEQPSEYALGDNDDEAEEVTPTPITNNAKRRTPSQKPHMFLDKPNKKPKSSSTLVNVVIQEDIAKISETASFVSSRQSGITIEQVMEHVVACGALPRSNEHFVATELFIKEEQREMFMTIPLDDRLNWLSRKYNVIYGGK